MKIANHKTTNTVSFHFYKVSSMIKFREIEITMVVNRAWGKFRKRGVYCLVGIKFHFSRMKNCRDLFHNINTLNTTELYS